jgi:hypothetical protein
MTAIESFSVNRRNPGHWDIHSDKGRIFRLRGAPGAYNVYDDREGKHGGEPTPFNTVSACMTYVCDQLMFELIKTQSQEIQIIEDWNS